MDAHLYAQISTKFSLKVYYYLMSLKKEFHKVVSFGLGDIPLDVTLYDFKLNS